ncbi:MAG: S46 family peptidase [Patescibacteria group bacterium]
MDAMARFLRIAVALLALAGIGRAEEGFWLPTALPVEQLKTNHNFTPTSEWVDHLTKTAVRLNSGGSGSFVSANGLVLTNHHVAADMLEKVSTSAHNYYRDGFYAPTLDRELRAPDLEINNLVDIKDVTDRVNAAVTTKMSTEEAVAARRAIIAHIEKESTDKTKNRSDVVAFYEGALYHLYVYKKYTDVRLVWAPEARIAQFGGDPDNFEFPRYCLDAAFFRVYENGKPAMIEHYLTWSQRDLKEGELVFVVGHPGRSQRFLTNAALEFYRDLRTPYGFDRFRRQEIMWQQYQFEGIEQYQRAAGPLFFAQNFRKVYDGVSRVLQDPAFIAAKEEQERAFRARVDADPELKQYAGAWSRIEAAEQAFAAMYFQRFMLEVGHGFESDLFVIARGLVRRAEEIAKPNSERLEEFQESSLESLDQQLFSPAPIYADMEVGRLGLSLTTLVERMGFSEPLVQQILAGKSPHERAAELVAGSKLADVAERKRMADGGKGAINQSNDSMIKLALLVDPPSREARKQFEQRVEEPERQAYADLTKARFALAKGQTLYPDATFTLRVSYGTIKGYKDGGQTIPPWTTIGGLYTHAKAHQGKEPWDVPDMWFRAKVSGGRLATSKPFNFVSTTDTTGGNSGSPAVNASGELIGLLFDGNIYGTASSQTHTTLSRSISVSAAVIEEALRHVYNAGKLADELTRRQPGPKSQGSQGGIAAVTTAATKP